MKSYFDNFDVELQDLETRWNWGTPGWVLQEDRVERYAFRLKMDQTRRVPYWYKKPRGRRCLKRRVWRCTDRIGRLGPLVLNGRSSVAAYCPVGP